MFEVRNKFHSLRLLGVIALLGSASIAHANPEDAMPLPDRSALSAFDLADAPGLDHATSNPKKQLPKIKNKKKKSLPKNIKVKDEAGSEDQSVPDATSGPTAVDKYKQSKNLLVEKKGPAKTAIDSVNNDEFNNKEDAVEGVPIPANLSLLRRAIIDRARGELGKVEGQPVNPVTWKNPVTGKTIKLKLGIDRLVEYTAVAYGTNVGLWLTESTLTKLVTYNEKHLTWCGIFALWAVKMSAGVAASDYAGALQAVLDTTPALSPFAALFIHVFAQPGKSSSDKQLYANIQWDVGGQEGGGIYLYDKDATSSLLMDADVPGSGGSSGVKHRLSPTGLQNWLDKKKSVPPIKPGDIGVTRELNPDQSVTNHLYVIERILEVDGKYIYFTIEGNYVQRYHKGRNQMIVRNYRVYVPGYNHMKPSIPARYVIESWYDIEEMPRDSNNRHKKAIPDQP